MGHPSWLRQFLFWVSVAVLLAGFSGCQVERRKTDAELGLNPAQASGRAVFDRQCAGCHEAYSSRGLKGPSLQGMFRHPYMKNGMPANDARVYDIIVLGRAMMPGYSRALNAGQLDDLMAYLHTL